MIAKHRQFTTSCGNMTNKSLNLFSVMRSENAIVITNECIIRAYTIRFHSIQFVALYKLQATNKNE